MNITEDRLEELLEQAATRGAHLALETHNCPFSDPGEVQLIKDVASGAKLAKTLTIRAVVFAVMFAAASMLGVAIAKTVGIIPFLPRG